MKPTLTVAIVVGRFPAPSETFIYRSVTQLAGRGHKLVVCAAEIDRMLLERWKSFDETIASDDLDTAGLWNRVAFLSLFPNRRDRSLDRYVHQLVEALGSSVQLCSKHPFRALQLLRSCFQQARGIRSHQNVLLLFLRHLPYLELSADVVHIEFLSLAPAYRLVRQIVRAPIVVSCRGADLHLLPELSPRKRELALRALVAADAVHCVSAEMAAEARRQTSDIRTPIVIRPAVPVSGIRPKERYSLGSRARIIWVGRLVWKKAPEYFLRAIARVYAARPDLEAVMIGEGPMHAPIEATIRALGLADCCTLAGRMQPVEVLRQLHGADIFVCSSHEEGISNSLLEAMAAGLPIVTTSAGGIAEAVQDGIEGLITPVRDIPALAREVIRLLGDGMLRQQLGEAARQRALHDFDLQRQTNEFEAMYQQLTERTHEVRRRKPGGGSNALLNTIPRESGTNAGTEYNAGAARRLRLKLLSLQPLTWDRGYEFLLDGLRSATNQGLNFDLALPISGDYREAVQFAARQHGFEVIRQDSGAHTGPISRSSLEPDPMGVVTFLRPEKLRQRVNDLWGSGKPRLLVCPGPSTVSKAEATAIVRALRENLPLLVIDSPVSENAVQRSNDRNGTATQNTCGMKVRRLLECHRGAWIRADRDPEAIASALIALTGKLSQVGAFGTGLPPSDQVE